MYSWDRGLESIVQRRLMRTVPSPNECSSRWPSGDEWSILHRAPGGIPAPQTPACLPSLGRKFLRRLKQLGQQASVAVAYLLAPPERIRVLMAPQKDSTSRK